MKISKRILNILFVAALIVGLLPMGTGFAEGTALVTDGYDPDADLKAGVRFRSFVINGSDREAYLGDPDSFTGPGRTELNITWTKSPNGNPFLLSYDRISGNLELQVNGQDYDPLAIGDIGDLNYIKLEITRKITQGKKPAPPAPMDLVSFKVNGVETIPSSFTSTGTHEWSVTGIDLTDWFEISGKITFSGTPSSGDSYKVEIGVGYTEIPKLYDVEVNPSPSFWHADAALTASVETNTQLDVTDPPPPLEDVIIARAEYTLNGILGPEMIAADGAFDESGEEIRATFAADELGDNQACVQAWDNLQTPSDVLCQIFDVFYVFDGFFDPIAFDSSVVNEVKAGQAIPIKWRLTDGLGVPIEDPASFVGVLSYPVSCTDYLGDSTDTVEEYSPGTSGLQYNGDGYWQFNWKTPKTYQGLCRAFFVQFNDGQISVPVKFHFK